jgi:cytochrome c oxidase accessory protein FixG
MTTLLRGAGAGDAPPGQLYKKREPIFPKLAHGSFRNIKWIALIFLLAIYYLTPWIRWDRGVGRPDQAVLVDFEARRFYFFFIELWPQEVYYITGLLIIAALGLFLATALFGRIWCGYACPQTVWTDLYLHVERLIEGDRAARMRLAKSKTTLSKAVKKIVKHSLWIAIAAATGGAWVFYFADAPTLFGDIFTGQASLAVYLFIGILTFTTYTLAGTMREQVCEYMCPWPRIQAALIDKDSLAVTYRGDRGEPRGPHKKDTTWEGRGDCIDCNQCVEVCPMGIDIRNGDQLECINCALCIDACDAIMTKVERPTGLIAYDTSLNVTQRSSGGAASKFTIWRPRIILYATLLVLVSGLMTYGLANRQMMRLDVTRDRSPPFVRLANGDIRNDYELKVMNLGAADRPIDIVLLDAPGARISMFGDDRPTDKLRVNARADAVTNVRVHVIAPPDMLHGAARVRFELLDPANGDVAASSAASFMGTKE